MSTKRRASPSELDELLSEVDPRFQKKLKREKIIRESGESSNPVPRPRKKIDQKEKDAFVQLCFRKAQLDLEVKKVQEEGNRVKDRISKVTELRGKSVGKDKIFYAEGKVLIPGGKKFKMMCGKAMLKFKQTGDIDAEKIMEWARDNAPDMIQVEAAKTLNVVALEAHIQNKKAPSYLADALKTLMDYGKKNPDILHEVYEENLDLAAYRDAKAAKKIPDFLIQAAENESGHYSLNSWLLDQGPRCPDCGTPKPKRQKQGVKFICKTCGHQE
jgi:hypothetical protein